MVLRSSKRITFNNPIRLDNKNKNSMQNLINAVEHIFDARPDTVDFRDKMYQPSLVEVPARIDLQDYQKWKVPILNQGKEGACTGFALATVANYLLRKRKDAPDEAPVSPRMLYEMAKRYDEWPGEDYEGSSARGAMKGWHKHGVASEKNWPYSQNSQDQILTDRRASDAARRPLGAYYRVNHKDLVAMHCAIAEVGILFATSIVHQGWERIARDGTIPFQTKKIGGHAFAIVGYNDRGFWIQNSWGPYWGKDGFALVTYDDWLTNGTDVWVGRLGAPVILHDRQTTGKTKSSKRSQAYTYNELRPHIISLDNNGLLKTSGNYGSSQEAVRAIFTDDFLRLTENWDKKRLLLYVNSGLDSEEDAIAKLATDRSIFLEHQVYPLALIWKTDYWNTLANLLQTALDKRMPQDTVDSTQDFMLDRLDDALEPMVRQLGGKGQWEEMCTIGHRSISGSDGGARITLNYLHELLGSDPEIEVHAIAHSAGSIFLAPSIQLLTTPSDKGYGHFLTSVTLWAPACTIALFKQMYLPAIQRRSIDRFALFTLADEAELDDHCAQIYHKSLLYLISHVFGDKPRIPWSPSHSEGEPILGMEKFLMADAQIQQLIETKRIDWVVSPNAAPSGSKERATARSHGEFDGDRATLQATLSRILYL